MKKNIDLAQAWRNEDYYMSLTEEERSSLGDHPAGAVNVSDDILHSITGGCGGGTTLGTSKTPCVTVCGDIYCN